VGYVPSQRSGPIAINIPSKKWGRRAYIDRAKSSYQQDRLQDRYPRIVFGGADHRDR
jgi:hypothetical protein